MTNRLRYIPLCLLALTMVTSTASQGQQSFAARNDQIVAAAPLPQDQLDALLAPIALYPDQLLAQVLMASTYPLDVANAARFVRENPSLTGAALDGALQDQNWDPSVLSLAAYPQMLLMMNDMPDWTQQLGEAFLANQQQVMDTVQMLRSRAQTAGNLQSSPQQTVIDQGGIIDIEPAQPQYVYVPVYDPRVIYGSWSDAYVPPYWYPPAIYGYPDLAAGFAAGIFFGTACRIDYNHWGWARPNWRGHDIAVNVSHNYFANRPQYADRWRNGRWAPSPEQRHSVASRDIGSQGGWPGNAALQSREPYRTSDPAQMRQAIARPAPQPRPFQQEIVRPVPQPPAFTRPPQLQQPITRTMPQPDQRIAHPVQQPQQGAWNAPPQSMYPVVHPTPRPQETFARPLPQQASRQSMTRALPQLPQPPQSFARSMPPPPQQFASPMAQPSARSAPQFAYNQQPRAQIQTVASYGQARDAGHGEANRMTMNSKPAQERGQR
jgi:Protein of unknown function (DUF3300)